MQNSWKECLESIFNNSTEEQNVTLAIALWAIWYSRNKKVHNRQKETAQNIISFGLTKLN